MYVRKCIWHPVAVICDELQNVERLAGGGHLEVELPNMHAYIHYLSFSAHTAGDIADHALRGFPFIT
jgi:hypothetical protein